MTRGHNAKDYKNILFNFRVEKADFYGKRKNGLQILLGIKLEHRSHASSPGANRINLGEKILWVPVVNDPWA